jgi:hypothetical protein
VVSKEFQHNDLSDRGPDHVKAAIEASVQAFLDEDEGPPSLPLLTAAASPAPSKNEGGTSSIRAPVPNNKAARKAAFACVQGAYFFISSLFIVLDFLVFLVDFLLILSLDMSSLCLS